MNPSRPWLLIAVLALAGCGSTREVQLAREVSELRLQLQQAHDLAREAKLGCEALAKDRVAALASARQLRADTQYLTNSTVRMSEAITRLAYDDWNEVVPEVQLSFTDVEAAANDLDSRVGRVMIALKADSEQR